MYFWLFKKYSKTGLETLNNYLFFLIINVNFTQQSMQIWNCSASFLIFCQKRNLQRVSCKTKFKGGKMIVLKKKEVFFQVATTTITPLPIRNAVSNEPSDQNGGLPLLSNSWNAQRTCETVIDVVWVCFWQVFNYHWHYNMIHLN